MTQAQEILEFMQAHGSITALQAMYDLGCFRLGARIFELRRLGHHIRAERIAVHHRNGNICHVCKYTLEQDND